MMIETKFFDVAIRRRVEENYEMHLYNWEENEEAENLF